MKLNSKRIDFEYTPSEEIFTFSEDTQDEESARDPETAPITEEEFAQRILLTEVSVSPGGRFTAYYNDDDMFWGHVVTVDGILKKGPIGADMQG